MYNKMMDTQVCKDEALELAAFIQNSPTPFHAVEQMAEILKREGFLPLAESDRWEIHRGGRYYVTRNHSSILAFEVGNDVQDYGFQIAASHSDSPTFKVKAAPELEGPEGSLRLNVEAYGGMTIPFDDPMTYYSLDLPKAGDYELRVSRIGYEPQTVKLHVPRKEYGKRVKV